MFRLLLKMNRKEWLMMLVAVFFIGAGVWLDLRIPEFTQEILDIASPNPKVNLGRDLGDIWVQGAWMLGCTVASVVTVVIVGYIVAMVSASHSARVRGEIFDRVGSFPAAEMKRFSVASLITRSTNDVTQVRMFFAMGLQFMIKAPLTAGYAVLKITDKSWDLSFVTMVAVIALIVFISFLLFVVMPKFRRIQKLTDNVNQVARDNLTGIRVVRAYNAEEHEAERFEDVNDKLTRNNLFTMRAFALMQPFMTILMTGLGLALWYTGAKLINTPGEFASPEDAEEFMNGLPAFMSYSVQIVMAFMFLIMVFIMLPRASISAARINEVLRTEPSIIGGAMGGTIGGNEGQSEKGGSVNGGEKAAGDIEFKNISFKYPDAADYVFKDINISIKRGQTVAFIGSTGSGKSTLINLVPRIYDATEGELLVGGVSIKDYTLEALSDKVGYIPQTAVLFKGTVRSNIAFGMANGKQPDDDEIWKALEVAQAADFVRKLEGGLDAEIAQGGKNLSGGQKQRISIARVIARKPDIFIFDDSFSALDYKTDKLLRAALNSATADSTKLIVAQRIGTIKEADKIVVLDAGIVVGQGTHKELLKSCEVYKEIAYSQLSKEELA